MPKNGQDLIDAVVPGPVDAPKDMSVGGLGYMKTEIAANEYLPESDDEGEISNNNFKNPKQRSKRSFMDKK